MLILVSLILNGVLQHVVNGHSQRAVTRCNLVAAARLQHQFFCNSAATGQFTRCNLIACNNQRHWQCGTAVFNFFTLCNRKT